MKKRSKFKFVTGWLLTLAVMLSTLSPAFASLPGNSSLDGIDTTDPVTQELINAIKNLQTQVDGMGSNPTATPQVYAPNVKLLSPQSISAEPGQTLDVVISVINIGTSVASNVLTQATPEAPLSAVFLGNSNIVNSIPEGQSHSMTMTVTVDSKAEPGTYAITLDHSYKTRDDQNKTSTDKLFVQVAGSASEANVSLSGFASNRTSIMPGESVTITANIKNLGTGEATQVQTSLGEIDSTAIYLTSDINTNYMATMEAGYEGKVSFTFQAAENAKNGTYPVNLKLTYKTDNSEAKEALFTYFVNISSEESSALPNVQIKDLTATSEQVAVGANANISLHIINTGAGAASRVKVTATPSDTAAIVPTSGSIQSIPSLAPGAEQVLQFSFSPTPESKTRSYPVGFKVEYYESDEADAVVQSFEQYASVNANNPEEEEDAEDGKTSKPKIIVSEYKVDPVIVRAGREFDLDITFQNTSSVKAVENIKVTIEAIETTEKKGSVFSPVDGSNTLYIDTMDIKEEVNNKLRFYTVSDAEARSYKLQIKFQYQDEDLNDYEEVEQLAINVQQVTRLEAGEMYFPEMASVGDQIDLYTSIINSGKVTLYNVWVRVEAENEEMVNVDEADFRIGTIGMGNSASYDGVMIPTMAGTLKGDFVIAGEDDVGDPIEERIPFSIPVSESMGGDMIGDPGMMGDPAFMGDPAMTEGEPQGFFAKALDFAKRPYVWGTAIGIVVVIIIVIVSFVRRKKKRIDFDE